MTTETLERDLTVSEVAEGAEVSISAVRFYEKHGLVSASRTSGNQRRFDRAAPCRIRVARVAQRIGMTVGEIRELLALLPEGEAPQPEHWVALYDAILDEGQRRVRILQRAMSDIMTGGKLCEVPVNDAEPTPRRVVPAR
ncbi:MerR family transcriptional regulator [Luteipulveratus mongoliensis]|uniref:HTH merR-type domain-containing protein n=1 Tax=Luteipulveratus mongoliensis TaxID=571913 RepID=A0A0K1JEZ6_9MICO|nr:MerR family transcriptional regulator [Luteipulveratus mongoliensis]AKU15175.1 hypothetical protein VV02_03710 [Luteipulveratus mongoliensis]